MRYNDKVAELNEQILPFHPLDEEDLQKLEKNPRSKRREK